MWIVFLFLLLLLIYFFSSWVKNLRLKEFSISEVKLIQKKSKKHQESHLPEMPKSSYDTDNIGKSRK
jgi:Na+-transporting methylmalonyl-CoA/oxaloacetate decarboxylase gamma subunit